MKLSIGIFTWETPQLIRQMMFLSHNPALRRQCRKNRNKRLSEDKSPPSKVAAFHCNVLACATLQFRSHVELLSHWNQFHQLKLVAQLCPVQECSFQATGNRKMEIHMESEHNFSRKQQGQIRKLIPKLAEFVRNEKYVNPGTITPVTGDFVLPKKCLPFSRKREISGKLKKLLGTEDLVSQTTGKTPNHNPVAETPSESAVQQSFTEVPAPATMPGQQAAPSTSDVLAQLQALEEEEENLKRRRQALLRKLSPEQLAKENDDLVRRNQYLQDEVMRLRNPGRTPLPIVVGDLQRIVSTRALLLYPSFGRTSVYPLEASDYEHLNIEERDQCLSCEPL